MLATVAVLAARAPSARPQPKVLAIRTQPQLLAHVKIMDDLRQAEQELQLLNEWESMVMKCVVQSFARLGPHSEVKNHT